MEFGIEKLEKRVKESNFPDQKYYKQHNDQQNKQLGNRNGKKNNSMDISNDKISLSRRLGHS